MNNELSFIGENPNERIILVLRRHPWTMMKSGLSIVILLWFITAVIVKYGLSGWPMYVVLVLVPICLYVAISMLFMWYNSIYMLTNERLIAVNQSSWFRRTVRELQLTDISTVSHEISGFVATLLNYGTIDIVAAGGSERDMSIANIYDPYDVQQRIIHAKRNSQKDWHKSITDGQA